MLQWLIQSSIRARGFVLALALLVIGLGLIHVKQAQTDALPEFSPPYVEVQTEALGLSADEVEQLITAPMENLLLNGVAFLDGIRSESVSGLSSITLIFEPGTDLLEARQVVQERLTQAKLLQHLTEPPAIVQPMSSSSRVLVVGLNSQEISPIEMSVLARWTVRPKLLGVPGVSNVSIFGQRERQLQVQVDPKTLAAKGVTLQEIINTSGNALWVSPLTYLNASSPGTGGFVDSESSRLEIRHVSPISTPADLAQIALERAPGTTAPPLTLGDVTSVNEDHQPLIGDAVVDDGPGLILVIDKLPGANTLEVTEGLEEALATLQPGLTGISIDSSLFRPADFVENARSNYLLSIGLGLLLAIGLIVLVLFTGRAAIVVLVSATTSVLATLLALDALGLQLNALVLAGLVIALVIAIQDAVSDIGYLTSRLAQTDGVDGTDETQNPEEMIVRELLHNRRVMGYAAALLALAALPFLVLGRLSESFFRPAVLTVLIAVGLSTLIALTLTPALATWFLRAETRTSPIAEWCAERGATLAGWAASAQKPILVVSLAVTVVALGTVPLVDRATGPALLPTFKETALVVKWQGDPGNSRERMTVIATDLGRQLREIPGVASVGGNVGRAVLSDRINGIAVGELWIGIDGSADYDQTAAQVNEVASGYEGATAQVSSYYSDRVESIGGLMSQFDRGRVASQDDEVVVRVYGERFETLSEQAKVIESGLSRLDGVSEVRIESPPVEPNLEIEVDLDAAEKYGLKPGDIRRAATTLSNGLKVGSLFEDQKVFDVVVTGSRDYFADPDRVGELLIDLPNGDTIRLDEVAKVSRGESFSVISRESVSRRLDVVATIDGDQQDMLNGVRSVISETEFPLEYHAEIIGDTAERDGDFVRVLLVSIGSLIAGLLLIQLAVGTWRRTLVATLAITFAGAGGLLALWLGSGITLGSVLGLIAIGTLATRCVIGLLMHYQRMLHSGAVLDVELMRQGAREWTVSAVLMTVSTAAIMLPAAVLGSRAGLELIHPMALVVVPGSISTLLAVLLVTPALFSKWGGTGSAVPVTGPRTVPAPTPSETRDA